MKNPDSLTYYPKAAPLLCAILASSILISPVVMADTDKKREQVLPEPVIRIDPLLLEMAVKQEQLPVIIVFAEQPQREVAAKVRASYNPAIDRLAEQVRDLYARYLPKESLSSQEEEVEHSKLLEQYVSEDDKALIKLLNAERERLVNTMRSEIARQYTLVVAQKIQAKQNCITEVSMAKNFATDTADFVTYEAVQIFGGMGSMRESMVKQLYRDARWTAAAALHGHGSFPAQ